MKTEAEIREKFAELYERRLWERQQKLFDLVGVNCEWNIRTKVAGHGEIGFCTCPLVVAKRKSPILVCEGRELAEKCPCFTLKHSKESVKSELDTILRNPSVCGKEEPKLAVLLWCLQGAISLNWWSRLKLKLKQYLRL